MGYIPTQDLTGNYLMQGMQARSQGIAQGLQSFLQMRDKQAEENDKFNAQFKGAMAFLGSHEKELNLPEGALKDLQNNPNLSAREKYLRATSYLNNAILEHDMKQKNAQMALANAQAAHLGAQTQEMTQNNAFLQSELARIAAQRAQAQPTPAVPVAPQDAAAGGVPMAPAPVAPAAGPKGDPSKPFSPQNPVGVIDENAARDNYIATYRQIPKGGQLEAHLDRMRSLQKQLLNQNEVQPSEEMAKPDSGGKVLWRVDKKTGQGIAGSERPNPDHPEVKAASKAAEEEASLTVKRAGDFNTSIANAAQQAQADRPRLNRIRDLYASGAESGFGQDWLNNAKAVAVKMNIANADKQANAEELQALIARDAFQNVLSWMKGGGSVSNAERDAVLKASQSIGKTKGANLALINMIDGVYAKADAAEELRQKLEDEGKSERQIASEVRKWVLANPLSAFIPASAGSAGETPATAAAPALSGQDKAAYDWATANPSDPRSKAILKRLGL